MEKHIRRPLHCDKAGACETQVGIWRVTFIAFLAGLVWPFVPCFAAQTGEAVNVVPFGELNKWGQEGKDYGVTWEDPPKRIYVRFRHPQAKRITRCQLNGKDYKNFDPEKEWVLLASCPSKRAQIVAFFD